MGQDLSVPEMVKVMLKFHPAEDLPSSEGLWAAPGPVPGTYRLENSSFMVPLGAGDIVRADPTSGGVLQVTGLVQTSDMILTVVASPPGSALDLQPFVESWSASGAYWTEGRSGMLVTVWAEWLDLPTISGIIQPVLDAGADWLATAPPAIRVVANMTEVDFELDQRAN